jgi:hypothetical protein
MRIFRDFVSDNKDFILCPMGKQFFLRSLGPSKLVSSCLRILSPHGKVKKVLAVDEGGL